MASNPDPPQQSRRGILKTAYALLANSSVVKGCGWATSGVAGSIVLDQLREYAEKIQSSRYKFSLRREIFMPERHSSSQVVMANDNPWVKSIFNEGPTDTTRTLCASFIEGAEEIIISANALQIKAAATSVILGSPTANPLARAIFQYEQENADYKRAGFRRTHKNRIIRTRWDYACGHNEIEGSNARLVKRNVELPNRNSQIIYEPLWGIIDNGSSGRSNLIGELDLDGAITEDHLLITRIPNFFDAMALKENMFMTFVGGANAFGSLGACAINNSVSLLKELYDESAKAKSESWQALYKIYRIDGEIKPLLLEFHVLDINFNEIERAMRGSWGKKVRSFADG